MRFRRWFITLALCWPLASAPAATAIVLEDPVGFQVKHTWSASSLGIPGHLGALIFSADGAMLYVVGASESSISALYAVPVTRDPATQDIVDIGPASAVVKVFSGNATTAGLDAGFEFGPAGTLFYTYWSANYLGERPGGLGGSETRFDMSKVGVPSSIAGLTFSPHLLDPGTGFGQLQISSWSGANLYDVPLTPAGGGIFTPGTARLFVTLPRQGTGAIQYIPSGPSAGDLMYVNWNFGEVRILAIDPTTGLPIDKTTGVPTRGTANPKDSRFAYGFGVGPWGLEFDPRRTISSSAPGAELLRHDRTDRRQPRQAWLWPRAGATTTPVRTATATPTGIATVTRTATPAATMTAARTATPLPTATPAGRDDFTCYKAPAVKGTARPSSSTFALADEFGTATVTLGKPQPFCAPTSRNSRAIADPTANLRCYKIQPPKQPKFAGRSVVVENDFGTQTLIVAKPQLLCLPSERTDVPSPLGIDHFECYKAKLAASTPSFGARSVRIENWLDAATVTVSKPKLFCNPVSTDGAVVEDPTARLVCYKTAPAKKACVADAPEHAREACKQESDCGGERSVTSLCVKQPALVKTNVALRNELGDEAAIVVKRDVLCVSSEERAP